MNMLSAAKIARRLLTTSPATTLNLSRSLAVSRDVFLEVKNTQSSVVWEEGATTALLKIRKREEAKAKKMAAEKEKSTKVISTPSFAKAGC